MLGRMKCSWNSSLGQQWRQHRSAATNCQSGQLAHRPARWPQTADGCWCPFLVQDKDDAAQLRFARRWVNCHVDAAAAIGKPVVLAEFGKKGGGPAREEFYRKVRPHRSANFRVQLLWKAPAVLVQQHGPVGRRPPLQPSRSSRLRSQPDHGLCLERSTRMLAVHTGSPLTLQEVWVHASARRSSASTCCCQSIAQHWQAPGHQPIQPSPTVQQGQLPG